MITKDSLLKHKSIFIRFIFSFSIVLIFLIINNSFESYRWDALGYFNLSNIFIGDSGFALYNFPISLRGAIFPLILLPFNYLASFIGLTAEHGWWFMIATLSGLFYLAFSAVFKDINHKKSPPPFILLFPLLIFFPVYL